MKQADLPIIDISEFASSEVERANIIARVGQALTQTGFMYIRGHGLDGELIRSAFATSQRFFAWTRVSKDGFAYKDIADNFGFQGMEVESLDPANLPDLKETFTMRNALGKQMDVDRWPDAEFRTTALTFYAACLSTAYKIMNVLAACLQLPTDFFMMRHVGVNVTLRFLHYPANMTQRSESQLGAGAHTDYGSITLLMQDDVGGLEVLDAQGEWRQAVPVPEALVINTGDLMERWTNGMFRSTVHRVRPVTGNRDRYSIALFVDPDPEVEVECIPSCATADRPPRYSTITAGEHIKQKIAVTHAKDGNVLGKEAASPLRSC
jgi:isopenicillin N synthase-like dioxygenase